MASSAEYHDVVQILARVRSPNESRLEYTNELLKRVKLATERVPYLDEYGELKPILRWTYVSLDTLKNLGISSRGDPNYLMSVPQQQDMKRLLRMIFSLGVTIKIASIEHKLDIEESRTEAENYNVTCKALHIILPIINNPKFRAVILVHLRDILAALLKISFSPIKKPSASGVTQIGGDDFVMTQEWYDRLMTDRPYFVKAYKDLTDSIYRPLLIKELLILLGRNKIKENPAPKWLEREINGQLNKYLLLPDGVAMLMITCCPADGESLDMTKVDLMARIITTVPQDADKFYSAIAPQIIRLLETSGEYALPVARLSIRKILESDPERCRRFILNKIFEPFYMASQRENGASQGRIVGEEALGNCIEILTKCFTAGSSESCVPIQFLSPVVKLLLTLHTVVKDTAYRLKANVRDLLLTFLYAEREIHSLAKIYNSLLFDEGMTDMWELNPNLMFGFGPSGGVLIMPRIRKLEPASFTFEEDIKEDLNAIVNAQCRSLLELLSQYNTSSRKLLYDLFTVLILSLSDLRASQMKVNNNVNSMGFTDYRIVPKIMRSQKKPLLTLLLLGELAEYDMIVECFEENPSTVLGFLKSLLSKQCRELEAGRKPMDHEIIGMELELLNALSKSKPGSEIWNELTPFVKYLAVIMRYYPDLREKAKFLIERFTVKMPIKRDISELIKETLRKTQRDGKSTRTEKSLEFVFDSINSEEIADKAYGLILLKEKIYKAGDEVKRKAKEIFELLDQELNHTDSYIYLIAVSALEILGRIEPDKSIELLCDSYTNTRKEDLMYKLKVGEVLVRMVRRGGAFSPPTMNRLINTFLFGVKSDKDELFRASCLSNLGGVLEQFKYACGPILFEICECATKLAMDRSPEVRRASVALIKSLIKGQSSFSEIAPVLTELYRLLLHIVESDKDEATRKHADEALDVLGDATRAQLSRNPVLEKKISILGFDH